MTDKAANIGLTAETVQSVTTILRRLLGNQMLLMVKIKQFHWNIRGAHFVEYHEKFDEMAADILAHIDETAERIRMLGVDAPGSMQEFITDATLQEIMPADQSAQQMITLLLQDYETLIQEVRNDISSCADLGDDGNADVLTAMMEAYEKTAWMMRATIS